MPNLLTSQSSKGFRTCVFFLQIKTNETSLLLSSTDQLIIIAIPWLLVGAWFLFLICSWTLINRYADLCYDFCQRGFRIGMYDLTKHTTCILLFSYLLYYHSYNPRRGPRNLDPSSIWN